MYSKIRLITLGIVVVILFVAVSLAIITAGCSENLLNESQFRAFLDDPNMAAGRAVFEKNCIGCHPYGKTGVGPNLSKKKLTAEAVKKQVRKGGLIMPAFSAEKINNESLEQLAVFVAALNKNNR